MLFNMTYQKILEKIGREFSKYQIAKDRAVKLSSSQTFDLFLMENEILVKYDDVKILVYFDERPTTYQARRQIKELTSLVKSYKDKVLIAVLSGEPVANDI